MDSNHLPVLPINKHVLHLHLHLQGTCYQPGPGQQHEDERFRWDDHLINVSKLKVILMFIITLVDVINIVASEILKK